MILDYRVVNLTLYFRIIKWSIAYKSRETTSTTSTLSNLLSNAIKFTNQGEISIALNEKIYDNNEDKGRKKEVIVSVTDAGSGIDSEIFTRLFSKFASKSYQGIGLGLFICRSIIQAHGGRIWAENNNINGNKSGATITFSLPAASKVDGYN